MTGKTLDVDASITTYDSDGDGALSEEETGMMMREVLGPPPSSTETSAEQAATEQATTFTARQASEAYLANSGEDSLARLMDLLEQLQSATSGSEKS